MNYHLLHTADLHFGKSRKIEGYLNRQIQAMEWIYAVARKYNVSTIVIAGDIYEKCIVKDDERKAFTNRLLTYDNEGYTTIIINGNHDWMTEKKLNIWDLQMLQEERKFHNTFIITGEPQKITVNGYTYLGIPNRGMNRGRNTAELTKILDNMCDDKTIVILHELLRSAITDKGFISEEDCSIQTKANPLYIAMGDVHRGQRMGYAQFYSGPPVQHDFGDKYPKGCLLVDLEKPDRPGVIYSEHIKKFIKTSNVEEIYQDAFIEFIGTRTDLPLNVPKNIIKIKDAYDKQEVIDYTTTRTKDLTDGLPEFLTVNNLNEDEQIFAIKEVEDIVSKMHLY